MVRYFIFLPMEKSAPTKLSIFIALIGITLLSACSKSDDEKSTSHLLPEVTVIFSPDGVGDGAYNDQILRGIELMVNEHQQDLNIMFLVPKDLEDAEFLAESWLETTEEDLQNNTQHPQRLLLMASSSYTEIAQRVFEGVELSIDRCVLAFESKKPLSSDEKKGIHSFDISMYGASFLAGRTVREMGCKKPLVLLGNGSDSTLFVARDGFREGYEQQGAPEKVTISSIADNYQGYGMSSETYRRMYDIAAQGYDFIYCVAGGSNMGVYRYLRENPNCGIYTAGMDVDQSPYSTLIVGSMVKRIDLVLYDYLTNWFNKNEIPSHRKLGIESGYIDWVITDRYASLKAGVEANRQEAINKENAYENF